MKKKTDIILTGLFAILLMAPSAVYAQPAEEPPLIGTIYATVQDSIHKPVQGDGELDWAEFTVYNASNDAIYFRRRHFKPGEEMMRFLPDKEGHAESFKLPKGTYKIKMTRLPTGYDINEPWEKTVTIDEQHTSIDAGVCECNIKKGDILIQLTKSVHEPYYQGGGTKSEPIKGEIFEVVNRSENAVIVNGKLYKPGEVVTEMTARRTPDGYVIAYTEANMLPYGYYGIRAKSHGTGYLGKLEVSLPYNETHFVFTSDPLEINKENVSGNSDNANVSSNTTTTDSTTSTPSNNKPEAKTATIQTVKASNDTPAKPATNAPHTHLKQLPKTGETNNVLVSAGTMSVIGATLLALSKKLNVK